MMECRIFSVSIGWMVQQRGPVGYMRSITRIILKDIQFFLSPLLGNSGGSSSNCIGRGRFPLILLLPLQVVYSRMPFPCFLHYSLKYAFFSYRGKTSAGPDGY